MTKSSADPRPSRDQTLMQLAWVWSQRGTCSRLQVGAIVSRDGRSLVSGYNGVPAGLSHCRHDCTCLALGIPGEEHEFDCPAAPGEHGSMHAEANAIAYAARFGIRLEGAEMYCTDSPCIECARLMINAGLKRLVYAREYRLKDGVRLLQQAGLTVEILA